MRLLRVLLLICVAASGRARVSELLVNGDFEQPFATGWRDTVANLAGSGYVEQLDTLGGTGYAMRAYKELAAYTAVAQTVDVPDTNLSFSFDARFRIGGGSSTCWPVAGLVLRYRDAAGTELGNTKFILHNEFCTWSNSDTAHIVEVEVPEEWRSYNLDIANELRMKLPGVNRAEVRQITVQLYAYDNGT